MLSLEHGDVSTRQSKMLVQALIPLQAWTALHVFCIHITVQAEVQIVSPNIT